jgi:hypothetical protein
MTELANEDGFPCFHAQVPLVSPMKTPRWCQRHRARAAVRLRVKTRDPQALGWTTLRLRPDPPHRMRRPEMDPCFEAHWMQAGTATKGFGVRQNTVAQLELCTAWLTTHRFPVFWRASSPVF